MVAFLQLGDGPWASQHFKVEFILYLSLRALCETEQAWSMQIAPGEWIWAGSWQV
jgi:hypothetical protein